MKRVFVGDNVYFPFRLVMSPDGSFSVRSENLTEVIGPYGADRWAGTWIQSGEEVVFAIERAWSGNSLMAMRYSDVRARIRGRVLTIPSIPGASFGQGRTAYEEAHDDEAGRPLGSR
jgi:hypothetical protein